MVALSEYLQGEFVAETNELDDVDRMIDTVLPVFASFFLPGESTWPYQVLDSRPVQLRSYSTSTTAMIAFSLAAVDARIHRSALVPSLPRSVAGRLDQGTVDKLIKAVAKLVATLHDTSMVRELADQLGAAAMVTAPDGAVRAFAPQARSAWRFESLQDTTLLGSTVWGQNDPFSLMWILELLGSSLADSVSETAAAEVVAVREALIEAANDVVGRALDQPGLPLLQVKKDYAAVVHPFPILRAVQLAQLLERLGRGRFGARLARVRDFFFNELYAQLSYSEIRDSSFDVADLVFTLEGLLTCNPRSIGDSVLARVLGVIGNAQDTNPNWRPRRPLQTTQQGFVLVPLSIEVANSLLRTADLVDQSRGGAACFAACRGMFRRYLEWLRSSRVEGTTDDGRQFSGWQSEHTYSLTTTLHLWQTSHVILFLFNYRTLLERHIAAEALQIAKLSAVRPPAPAAALGNGDVWEQWEKSEPLLGVGEESGVYSVFRNIRRSFLEPRLAATGASVARSAPRAGYSFLLYGPPGTGKTTVAAKVAESLGWQLVSLSPSDFVVSGAEQVEARAKDIFEVLERQVDVVVFFDELDRMLLDRDSDDYKQQSDMFQFMTPAMLTKLNSLRDRKRCIFAIATNYASRIDPAITRTGRIDARYLLLPPGLEQRERTLTDALAKRGELRTVVPVAEVQKVARQTALYTHGELATLVLRAGELAGDGQGNVLRRAREQLPRSIDLTPYQRRLASFGPNPPEILVEELLLLTYLLVEVTPDSGECPTWVRSYWQRYGRSTRVVRDAKLRSALEAVLAEPGTNRP
jgi:hypothetical protein